MVMDDCIPVRALYFHYIMILEYEPDSQHSWQCGLSLDSWIWTEKKWKQVGQKNLWTPSSGSELFATNCSTLNVNYSEGEFIGK